VVLYFIRKRVTIRVPVSQVVDCLKFLESVNIGALQRRAASCLRALLAALALPPAEPPYYLSASSLSLFTVPPRAARAPPARRPRAAAAQKELVSD
jgi:hypothetical protein